MAKGKLVGKIKRKPKHLYYVDGAGDVREMAIRRRRKKSKRK
jgi:hypothetical protein